MARRKTNPENPKPIAEVTHRKRKKCPMKRESKVFGAKNQNVGEPSVDPAYVGP